jgi:hypothetical protein
MTTAFVEAQVPVIDVGVAAIQPRRFVRQTFRVQLPWRNRANTFNPA